MGKDGAQYVVIAAGGGGPAARGMRASDAVVSYKLGSASTSPSAREQPAMTLSVPRDPLPEDVGKSTVVKLCSQCHAVEQAVSIRGAEKEWQETVDSMIERGATGTPEEFREVIAYLTKHFGTKH
jgi:hypothetical protein